MPLKYHVSATESAGILPTANWCLQYHHDRRGANIFNNAIGDLLDADFDTNDASQSIDFGQRVWVRTGYANRGIPAVCMSI